MYAIVQTGGKQYRVEPGDTLDVELLHAEAGSEVELDRVLLIGDGEETTVGRPFVDGAKVQAEVVEEGRGKKMIVFKFKPKVRYRLKNGHRQGYTRLTIRNIVKG